MTDPFINHVKKAYRSALHPRGHRAVDKQMSGVSALFSGESIAAIERRHDLTAEEKKKKVGNIHAMRAALVLAPWMMLIHPLVHANKTHRDQKKQKRSDDAARQEERREQERKAARMKYETLCLKLKTLGLTPEGAHLFARTIIYGDDEALLSDLPDQDRAMIGSPEFRRSLSEMV